MSKLDFLDDRFLLKRARQCRSMSLSVVDAKLRNRLAKLAADYEEIAKSVARLKAKDTEIVVEAKEPPFAQIAIN